MPTDGIVIETDMLSVEAANDVVRLFPLNGAVVGTLVRVGTPVPGHEAARDAVLARDGIKDMLGNLDMGGNDIGNLVELGATRVDADTVDADTVDAQALSVNGQPLTSAAIAMMQQLATLNCPGTIGITGGVASCSAPNCRLCANSQYWGSSSQCANRTVCTQWSATPGWSGQITDDTDDSAGGCHYTFRLECR